MTDSDRAALRECPFCNEHAGVVAVKVPPGYPAFTTLHFVRCNGCGVSTQQFTSRSMATAAWNTRAPGYAAGVEAALAIIRKREALDATQHDMLVALGMEIAALAPDAFRPLGFRDGVEAAAKDFLDAVESLCDWMNGNDLAADHEAQKPEDFKRLCNAMETMQSALALAPAVPEEQIVERVALAIRDSLAMKDADYIIDDRAIARAVIAALRGE